MEESSPFTGAIDSSELPYRAILLAKFGVRVNGPDTNGERSTRCMMIVVIRSADAGGFYSLLYFDT